jgi:hypothetical protein
VIPRAAAKSGQLEKISHAIMHFLVYCDKLVHSHPVPGLQRRTAVPASWKVRLGGFN